MSSPDHRGFSTVSAFCEIDKTVAGDGFIALFCALWRLMLHFVAVIERPIWWLLCDCRFQVERIYINIFVACEKVCMLCLVFLLKIKHRIVGLEKKQVLFNLNYFKCLTFTFRKII